MRRQPGFSSLLAITCLLSAGSSAQTPSVAPAPLPQPEIRPATLPTVKNLARLPLAFERLAGAPDRFIARGQGYTIGLEDARATIAVTSGKAAKIVSLGFSGTQPTKASTGAELPGKINYIRWNDPKKWQIGLSTYDRISWPDLYPGIDVIYYGNQQQIEFDLVVKPGADPDAIRLKVGGAGKLSIDDSGALNLGLAQAGLRVALPQIYQNVNWTRHSIRGSFVITAPDEVAFRVEKWDSTQPLIIDPTIVYSTLIGGDGTVGAFNSVQSNAIAVDQSGNILIAGYTCALDFPAVDAVQSAIQGFPNVFVTKINPEGTVLIFSTVLGGSAGGDIANGLAVDSAGSVWVTGQTGSSSFPTLNSFQSTFPGSSTGFVAALTQSGALKFSTFLGPASSSGQGIAVDSSGNGYVTGIAGTGFPITPGAFQPASRGGTVFVAKFSPAGTLLYSTLLGGPGSDSGAGIAVDALGNAYVTGSANSVSFFGQPAGGAQPVNAGGGDAFVAKLNANGSALVYFTFLGGSGADQGNAIAVDTSGSAYIAGTTSSSGLATSRVVQTELAGSTDGFVAKLSPSGGAVLYFTYLGGRHAEQLNGLALDGSGNIYVAGITSSADFPIISAVQPVMPVNGVSLFSSTNSGGSWAPFDANIPGAVLGISFNPSGNSGVALTESGFYRTLTAGASWIQQLNRQFVNGYASLSRSPVAPGTIYAVTCCSGICKSTDDGVTWNYLSNSPPQVTGVLCDPLDAGTVYAFGAGATDVSRSTDRGVTWVRLLVGSIDSMTATSDGALYISRHSAGVYKSRDQGNSWTAVNAGLETSFTGSLTASGTTVYLSTGFGIYKTTNGGAGWSFTSLPAYSVIIAPSPQNPRVLYASAGSGVLVSTDGGVRWSASGTGLASDPYAAYFQLVVDPANSAHVLALASVSAIAIVAKLNDVASALEWSTYLGNSASTTASAAASDGAGNVFVTGTTGPSLPYNFPLTTVAFTPQPTTEQGAFVAKISDSTASCSFPAITPLYESFVEDGILLVPQTGEVLAFSVVPPSGCTWSASIDQLWASITSASSGIGPGSITIQVPPNAGGATRSAVLTVGNQHVTISQPGGSCTYNVDKASYPVPAAGGLVSIALTATVGCPWSVVNDYSYPDRISITSGVSGTGSGLIHLAVPPIPPILLDVADFGRTFYLGVGNTTIRIVQAGRQLFLVDTSLPAGVVGTPYSYALTATGGTPPYKDWTLVWGSLPPGVTLNAATGVISGMPLTPLGSPFAFGVTVSDSVGNVFGGWDTHWLTMATALQGQTIAFGALRNQTPAASPLTLSATASSGLPVTYLSNTPTVCKVSGSTVTIVAAGGCAITAAQPGNTTYAPAPSVTQTFTVLFSDVQPTDPDAAAVDLLAQYGITSGCGNNDFCLNASLTRAELAVFIVRAIEGGDNFTYTTTPHFIDVPSTYTYFKWIQKLRDLGITSGCTASTFCPNTSVTRAQAAVIVIRARLGITLAGAPPSFNYSATPGFTDVAPTDFGFAWIQRMKRDAITSGCAATTYCPNTPVTRGQMAIFIMRAAFNQLLPAGTPVLSAISPAAFLAGTTATFTITGTNTHFVQGTTTISPLPAITIGTVTVNSSTSLTVQLTASANATAQPYSILAITGTEEAVLPNGLLIQ